MKKNQIEIDREFFTHVHNGIKHPLYTVVYGRKNNKVIKYTWTYGYGAFTMQMNVFIDKIKQKYENIECKGKGLVYIDERTAFSRLGMFNGYSYKNTA